MKKVSKTIIYSVLCSLCILSSLASYSQEQGTVPIAKFGIKGGFNFSNLYVDDVKDQNVKMGGVIGFFAKLPVAKGLSIQPELLYINKGAQVTYDNSVQGQGVYRFNLNYIEAPVTLVVNVIEKLNFNFGGYGAYLASANVKNVKEGTIIGVTELNESDFNRVDFGLIGGLGIDLGNVGLGVRYNYGLKQIGQPGTLAGELTKDSKNSSLSFTIALTF